MAGWLRLYTDIKNDRKLRRLPPAQRWLWVVIMTIAKESPKEGWLLLTEGVAVTAEDLADDAAVSIDEVHAGLKVFAEQRMIKAIDGIYYLVNWDKRQFVSDSSTERSRRHRQKSNATLLQRCSNVPATPPDTDTDIYINNNNDHSKPPVVNLVTSFEQETGRPLSPMNLDQIRQWERQYQSELILEALRKAITLGKYSMQYIDSILLNWQKNNIRTLAEVKAADKEFEQRKQKGGKSRGRDSPPVKKPDNADYANWSRPRE